MKKILILNGPNLNMLGIREPELYGDKTYDNLVEYCRECALDLGVDVDFEQTNHEGKMVDIIQQAYGVYDGLVLNAGAYTHYSVAILDALKAVRIKTVEVHLTDIDSRDEFRKISVIREACDTVYSGFGFESYKKALEYLAENI